MFPIFAAVSSFPVHICEILHCRLPQTADPNTNSLITRKRVAKGQKIGIFFAAGDSWAVPGRPHLQPRHVANKSWARGFKPHAYVIPGNDGYSGCCHIKMWVDISWRRYTVRDLLMPVQSMYFAGCSCYHKMQASCCRFTTRHLLASTYSQSRLATGVTQDMVSVSKVQWTVATVTSVAYDNIVGKQAFCVHKLASFLA